MSERKNKDAKRKLAPQAFKGTDEDYIDSLLQRGRDKIAENKKKEKELKLNPILEGLVKRQATIQEIQESLKVAGYNHSYPRINQLVAEVRKKLKGED